MTPLTTALAPLLAYHQGTAGGGNMLVLILFLGILATAGWLIFSELDWNKTLAVTGAGWAAILTVAFVF